LDEFENQFKRLTLESDSTKVKENVVTDKDKKIFQESFNQFEDQICDIQEEDAVDVKEKDEIKPVQLFLSYVPKNLEPFLPFSDPSLRILCSSLHLGNYFSFFFSPIRSVIPSIIYSLIVRWEFDPGGIAFQIRNASPSTRKSSQTIFPHRPICTLPLHANHYSF